MNVKFKVYHLSAINLIHKMPYYRLAEAETALKSASQIIVRVESYAKEEAINWATGETEKRSISRYEIVENMQKLREILATSTPEMAFHEVTKSEDSSFTSLQKLYFDIDAPSDSWGPLSQNEYETRLTTTLCKAVSDAYKAWFSPKSQSETIDLPVLVASSSSSTKVSLHIIFPTMRFKSNQSMGRFVILLLQELPPWIVSVIDKLYKKSQGLRMLHSFKLGSERKKKPLFGNWREGLELEDSLIHVYGEDEYPGTVIPFLDPYVPVPKNVPTKLNDPQLENALDALLKEQNRTAQMHGGLVSETHTFRPGNSVSRDDGSMLTTLIRTKQSMCPVCKRMHTQENAFFIERNGIWSFGCHRNRLSSEHYGSRPERVVVYKDIAKNKEVERARAEERRSAESVKRTRSALFSDTYSNSPLSPSPTHYFALEEEPSMPDVFSGSFVHEPSDLPVKLSLPPKMTRMPY